MWSNFAFLDREIPFIFYSFSLIGTDKILMGVKYFTYNAEPQGDSVVTILFPLYSRYQSMKIVFYAYSAGRYFQIFLQRVQRKFCKNWIK